MTWEFQDIFSSVICSGSVQSNIETDKKLTFNTRLWRANLKLRNAAFQSRETGEDCQPMRGEELWIRRCDWLLPWQQTSSAQQQAVNWQHCTARRCGHQHFFRVVQYNYFYISKIFLLKENIRNLQQKFSPHKSLRTPQVCEVARKIFVALWLKNYLASSGRFHCPGMTEQSCLAPRYLPSPPVTKRHYSNIWAR